MNVSNKLGVFGRWKCLACLSRHRSQPLVTSPGTKFDLHRPLQWGGRSLQRTTAPGQLFMVPYSADCSRSWEAPPRRVPTRGAHINTHWDHLALSTSISMPWPGRAATSLHVCLLFAVSRSFTNRPGAQPGAEADRHRPHDLMHIMYSSRAVPAALFGRSGLTFSAQSEGHGPWSMARRSH